MSIFPIGRKARDQKALSSANQAGGTVTIRSKNKISNPNNPGQTLGRGSQVIVRQTPSLKMDKPTITPGATHVHVNKQTSEKYTPGDFQEKVRDRQTTEALGKSLGEDPGKTRLRMKAQGEGKTSYKAGGVDEYAGRMAKKTSYSTTVTKDPDTKKLGASHVVMKKSTDVIPVAPVRKEGPGKSHSSIAIQRSSGSDKHGRPQNYMSLNRTNKAGVKKSVFKVKTFTPGSKGRTGSTILPRRKY